MRNPTTSSDHPAAIATGEPKPATSRSRSTLLPRYAHPSPTMTTPMLCRTLLSRLASIQMAALRGNLAELLESLGGDPERRIESRADVLETDHRGQFHELSLVEADPQCFHQLVPHRWRRVGHRLGVLQYETLQVIKEAAAAPVRHRLDLLTREAAPLQHPVPEVYAPRATDLARGRQIGQVPEPGIQCVPLRRALLQLGERHRDRHVVPLGAERIEHFAKPPSQEPFPDAIRHRAGRIE